VIENLLTLEKSKILLKMKHNIAKTLKNEQVQKKKLPEFLTQAHKENYEKGIKQIEEWQNSSATLKEIMERQKLREK